MLPKFGIGTTPEGIPFTGPLDSESGKPDHMHPLARALRRSSSNGCDDWTMGDLPGGAGQFVGSHSGAVKSRKVSKLV